MAETATSYHIPEKGDEVRLDVPPVRVGLHRKVREGEILDVVGLEITNRDGLCVKVAPRGKAQTYRLSYRHVWPVD